MIWEKDGVTLKGSHFQISSNGAIHIIFANEIRDKGTYRCRSSNVVGTIVSLPAKLGFPCKYMENYILGAGRYFWRGVAPKRRVFLRKKFADPTIKKTKKFFFNLKYQLKNKYPPLTENLTKGYHSVVPHVLYNFCDTSLITVCAIFCSLKFHVVCTCAFFGDIICLVKSQASCAGCVYDIT